jgi:hypothetical protein
MTPELATATASLVALGAGLFVATVVAALALRRSGSRPRAQQPARPAAPRPAPRRTAPRPVATAQSPRAAGGYARPSVPRRGRYAGLERLAAERSRPL